MFILSTFLVANVTSGANGQFFLYADIGGSIGFQSQPDRMISFLVLSGTLNCSNATIVMDANHGKLTFINNESLSFLTTSNMSRAQVNSLGLSSGDTTNVSPSTVTVVEWWITADPWLPYMFILGMVGLVSMFGGPICAIHLFKERDYRRAITIGCTITALGVGLFIAWLGAG